MDEKLIESLVADHQARKPIPSRSLTFFKWALIVILCLAVGISGLGLREDWRILFSQWSLLLQNLFILFSFFFSAWLVLGLGRPGIELKRKSFIFLSLFILCWSVLLILIGVSEGYSLAQFRRFSPSCIRDILIIGVIPGMALFFLLRSGVYTQRFLSGVLGIGAALGVGAWGVQFTCHNDDPIHILLWHFLPLLVLASLGLWVGKKFLSTP